MSRGVLAVALLLCCVPGNVAALSPNLVIGPCASGRPLAITRGVPTLMEGIALGTVDAREIASDCWVGFYDAPQACFRVPAGGAQVRVVVTWSSALDTTMLVTHEDGASHCDDDGAGELRPAIDAYLAEGEYTIRVGTFSQGVTAPFKLEISFVD